VVAPPEIGGCGIGVDLSGYQMLDHA
jgi:hypothetical protein